MAEMRENYQWAAGPSNSIIFEEADSALGDLDFQSSDGALKAAS
jgi:hypothetical protein